MRLLLNDRDAPLISSVGFFDAPMDRVAEEFVYRRRRSVSVVEAWARYKRKYPEAPPPTTRDPEQLQWGPWTDVFEMSPFCTPFPESLLQLDAGNGRAGDLLLETDSPWTAYFQNRMEDVEPGDVSQICERLRCRALTVSCIPHTLTVKGTETRGNYGNVRFDLFSAEPTGYVDQLLRALQVTMDDHDKWVFYAVGPIQPFEQPERYKARRVRDRFTAELLGEYAAAIGVRCFDDRFYGAQGCLIYERHDESDEAGVALSATRHNVVPRLG